MTQQPKGTCARILTPKQVGPICWFMAAFIAMFYSQRSRKLLLNASSGWNKKKNKELFTLLKHVLEEKYLKVGVRDSEDYQKFSDNTFGDVLKLLNKENHYVFPYHPKKVSGGFNSEFYMGRLYKLLGVDYRMYDYNISDNHLFYSYLNEDFNRFNSVEYRILRKQLKIYVNENKIFKYSDIEKHIVPPPVLILIVRDDKESTPFFKDMFPHTIIGEGDTKNELKSLRETIDYRGKEYHLDSAVLANWNIKPNLGHAISGITCKNNKYVYNGWTRTSMDPMMANKIITRNIPCELMKYDWNIKKHNDFCLNTTKCIPDVLKNTKALRKTDLCFNFSKGKRILVYVRKDAKSDTSMEADAADADAVRYKTIVKTPDVVPVPNVPVPKKTKKSPKKCEDGKVLNPETGRCILLKNAIAKGIIKGKEKSNVVDKKKSPKKCEDGKVLNPETGRCILLKNAIAKGIIIKEKEKEKSNVVDKKKSPKKCEDGKVLNPETGRCILLKNAIAKGIVLKK